MLSPTQRKLGLSLVMMTMLSGCATNVSSFCEIYEPVPYDGSSSPAVEDAINYNEAVYWELCQ